MGRVTGSRGEARLRVLREGRGYRLLFLATLASSVGTWLAFVALVIDVKDRTDDARWVSGLLLADFLPIVLLGFLAAPLVDRLPRKRLLIASDLVRAVLFCALPFAPSALAIVLLALGVGLATSLFRPAVYAALPNLVSDRQLPQANGLLQSADNMSWAIGSLAGGALVAIFNPDVAYWFNAATFALSALLIARIRDGFEEERAPSDGHWRDLRAGFSLIARSRPLLTVLVAWSIVMFATAGVNVAEVFLAKDVFDAGDFGYGLLVGTGAVGLVLGSLWASGLLERRGMRTTYAASLALMAVGYATAAAAPNVWIAAALVVVAGFGNGAAVVCNAILVQRGAPDRLRGRAFTLVMSGGYVFLGLGMIVAGPVTNALGARAAWEGAAAVTAVGAVAGLLLLRASAREAEQTEPVAAPGDPYPVRERS